MGDVLHHRAGDMTGSRAGTATLQALRARYSDLATDCRRSGRRWIPATRRLAVYHRKPRVIAVPEPGTPRDAKYRVDADQQATRPPPRWPTKLFAIC
jgi:hypothetical protein